MGISFGQGSSQYGGRAWIGKPLVRYIVVLLALVLVPLGALAAPKTIVAFGDSLTQGYGLAQGDGLVPQLQAWLDAAGADARVLNAGVSGDTTAGGRARIDWTLTPDVDAIIVNLGGNDILRGIDPATARANLDGVLAAKYDTLFYPSYLGTLMETGDRAQVLKTLMQPDAIHPNADGVRAIVKGLGPKVLELIAQVEQVD